MFYHTMKDHLVRHVEAMTARPTGSLWDYVPEPRLQTTPPLINDASIGMNHSDFEQQASSDVVDSANEDRDEAADTFQCLGCGEHIDIAYLCLDCSACPFHLLCLELHCSQAHSRPQEAYKEKEKAEEEKEILQREADDAHSQWVDQMTNLSKIAMPSSRRITSYVVALISVALAVEPFWSSAAAEEPMPSLQ